MKKNKIQELSEIIGIKIKQDTTKVGPYNLEELEEKMNEIIDSSELLRENINSDEKKLLFKKLRSQGFYVSEENKDKLLGNIYRIDEQKNFIPWFETYKNKNSMYYFERFRDYLNREKKIDWMALNQVDQHTNWIMDRCGNPSEDKFSKKGLVIGQVQSGKTLNYSMLVNKAADAGYKLIIVITTNIDALRKQTQERLENDFVGFRKDDNYNKMRLPLAKFLNDIKEPDLVTTLTQDFNIAAQRHSNLTTPRSEPIVIVSKKDTHILRSIFSAFYGENYKTAYSDKLKDQDGSISNDITKEIIEEKITNMPLLFIDDEADVASLNNKKEDQSPSKINEIIRCILAIFRKKSYVAYTATPYANCFVDPYDRDEKQLLNDDLYPSSFIDYIEPPKEKYMGYSKFFYDPNKVLDIENMMKNKFFIDKFTNNPYVSIIQEEDYHQILPIKHPNGHIVTELPKSLLHAIRIFVITRAIQIKEDFKKNDKGVSGSVNHSMVINVSRYKSVHVEIFNKVKKYLIDIEQSFRLEDSNDNLIKLFQDSFDIEFKGIENINYTFKDISYIIYKAVKSIVIKVINDSSEDKLDYDNPSFKDSGRHIIAIGGQSLSRGITLEGLTTTYMLRDTPQDDTLLQLARWFGYRTNPKSYEYMCRVFLPEITFKSFREASETIDDFVENQIKAMINMNYSPLNFGLMVRQSKTGRRLTANAKMRSAQKDFLLKQNYSEKQVHFHSYYNNEKINRNNLVETEKFIKEIDKHKLVKDYRNQFHLYENIAGNKIYKLIEDTLEFHREQIDLNKFGLDKNKVSLLGSYIFERMNAPDELDNWDIAIPYKKNSSKEEEKISFAGFNIVPRSRKSIKFKDNMNCLYFPNYNSGDPSDITIGFDDKFNIIKKEEKETTFDKHRSYFLRERQKPLLLISPLTILNEKIAFKGPLISYSIYFNKTKITNEVQIGVTNKVFIRQIEESQQTDFSEEEE